MGIIGSIRPGFGPLHGCNGGGGGGGGGGTTVLTFGSVDADFRSWAALPLDAGEGSLAVDVRSGAVYVAVTGFGKAWWLPAGSEWEVVGGIAGDESGILELNAQGIIEVTGSGGTVIYLPSGGQGIQVALTASTFFNLATPDLAPDGFDANTPVCIIGQSFGLLPVGSPAFTKALLLRQDRQFRLGRPTGGSVDRFSQTGGTTINEQSNWGGAVGSYSLGGEHDHLDLCVADGRVESRFNGACYLASPVTSFAASAGTTYDARIGPSTGVGSTITARILRWVVAKRL
jgi:hypothetical protein